MSYTAFIISPHNRNNNIIWFRLSYLCACFVMSHVSEVLWDGNGDQIWNLRPQSHSHALVRSIASFKTPTIGYIRVSCLFYYGLCCQKLYLGRLLLSKFMQRANYSLNFIPLLFCPLSGTVIFCLHLHKLFVEYLQSVKNLYLMTDSKLSEFLQWIDPTESPSDTVITVTPHAKRPRVHLFSTL